MIANGTENSDAYHLRITCKLCKPRTISQYNGLKVYNVFRSFFLFLIFSFLPLVIHVKSRTYKHSRDHIHIQTHEHKSKRNKITYQKIKKINCFGTQTYC